LRTLSSEKDVVKISHESVQIASCDLHFVRLLVREAPCVLGKVKRHALELGSHRLELLPGQGLVRRL
jgi:hypothetical protein